jgi:uncharacterized C2H2 Zn-finger protein
MSDHKQEEVQHVELPLETEAPKIEQTEADDKQEQAQADGETFACPDCDRTYTAQSNLLRHRKKAHQYVGPRSKVEDEQPAAPPVEQEPQPEQQQQAKPERKAERKTEQPSTTKLVTTRKPQSAKDAEKGREDGKRGLARRIKTADVLDAFILRPFLPPELASWEREMLEQGGVDEVEVPQIVYLAALTLAIVVPRAQAAMARFKESKQKAELDAQQSETREHQLAQVKAEAERAAAEARRAADAAQSAAPGMQSTVDVNGEAGQTRKVPNIAPEFQA